MTTCMIPPNLTVSGSLKNLEDIKWRHKKSLFTPVEIMSINYDMAGYTTTDEGREFWIYGDLNYKRNGRLKWGKSSIRKIEYKDEEKTLNAQLEYYRLWSDEGNLATIKQIDFRQILDSISIINGDSGRNTLDISTYQFDDQYPPALYGGEGQDKIIGSNFNDTLAASSSRDICDLDYTGDLSIRTKDILIGGEGSDTFYVDNGSIVKDIEPGETIYLYDDAENHLNWTEDKTPIFKQKGNKTIIKIGDIRVKTNLASYSYSHYFYRGNDLCWTTETGSSCDMGYIAGMPEGYAFTATGVF